LTEFKGGPREAAKMLQSMPSEDRKRILADMEKQNPELAKLVQEQMVIFEDLQYLTPMMMPVFLKDLSLEKLGLALRGMPLEFVDHLTSMVSKNIRADIMDIVKGPPKILSEVERAREEILITVREKIDKGEIVLDPSGSKTLVD